MSLEHALRLSVIQGELESMARVANARTARILRYAAGVLNLLKEIA